MAGALNKVMIIGNLGRDPEIRHTGEGKAVATLNVATSDSWKDRSTGERKEKTEWHRIVIFGGLAEVAEKYMKKGDTAYFEGKLQTRKWTDAQGQEKYTTEIVVDQFGGTMTMLGGRKSDGASSYTPPQDQTTSKTKAPAMAPVPTTNADVPFDDDIPF